MDSHLERLRQEITAAIAGFEPRQLSWHEPGKWCAAEILEHLHLSYTGTIKGCKRLLERGKPLASQRSFKNRAQSFIVVSLGYMPSGRKAPEGTRPRGIDEDQQKIVSEIGSSITEMDAILNQCAARFGARLPVLDHPLLGPFSIQQWRKFHLVHGLHHVKQIRNLSRQVQANKIAP
ncbi:MAG TPA: DUF1569 domain-containing protein [Candidatus Sulfotelmatobacter sp.]|nr:DUF1569 domain-containing protein [Candidatus Sulfotelmatobacter sp.]